MVALWTFRLRTVITLATLTVNMVSTISTFLKTTIIILSLMITKITEIPSTTHTALETTLREEISIYDLKVFATIQGPLS